jgi:hypothetical protein
MLVLQTESKYSIRLQNLAELIPSSYNTIGTKDHKLQFLILQLTTCIFIHGHKDILSAATYNTARCLTELQHRVLGGSSRGLSVGLGEDMSCSFPAK